MLEAGTGLVVLTASISYVLSVYPLVSEKRAASTRVRDLGLDEAEGALALVFAGSEESLARSHAALVSVEEDLKRFPVLYYFHAHRYEDELTPLLRAAALLAVGLMLAEPGVEDARRLYLVAHRRSLARFIESVRSQFDVEWGMGRRGEEVEPALRDLHELACERWPDRVAMDVDLAPPVELVNEVDAFLEGLAAVHGYDHRFLQDRRPAGG